MVTVKSSPLAPTELRVGAPSQRPAASPSTHEAVAPARSRKWHPSATVRVRILAAMLALAAAGLLLSGATAFVLLRERVDVRIDDALSRGVEEFRTLASDGVDPRTGQPFTSASDLVYAAMQRTAPAPAEGMVGLVSGEVRWTAPESVTIRPERDPELVARLAQITEQDGVRIRDLTTGATGYRYVAVPVIVVGDPAPAVFVLAYDRAAEQAELTSTFGIYALVAAGSLAVIVVAGWIVAGRLLAPVRLLGATARRITESDLSDRIPVTGNDDLSDLARTVNDMLDRLESALASQRNLLNDVGHELRTPLTILRGHLELLDVDDAQEVETTRVLALDEVDRMHRLVDDLVLLAKAEHPDFIRPVPVDVARLTDDVLDKARTLGPRRWVVEARATVSARLDPQRITQALLQLAANAVKFSTPGSTIAIGSAASNGHVRLWVRDEGQGVNPADAERIFERFVRGQAGRGVEGSGLGLPIVAAIAQAHRGTVQVHSRPGHGAIFTLDLPVHRGAPASSSLASSLEEDP